MGGKEKENTRRNSMKEENKVNRMYNQWKRIHKEFEKLGDPVSVECMKQTNAMLGVFEWVLDIKQKHTMPDMQEHYYDKVRFKKEKKVD
jgi:hypothetical protein